MYKVIREDIYFSPSGVETTTCTIVTNVTLDTATRFLESEYREQIDIKENNFPYYEYDKKYIKYDKTYAKLNDCMQLKVEHVIILQVVEERNDIQ